MMLRGALFDMDGLLLDTERMGQGVFCDLVAPEWISREGAAKLYLDLIGKSLDAAQDAVRALLPGIDVGQLDKKWMAGIDKASANGIPHRPTVIESLDALQAKGVPMAVVTMTRTDRARHHLQITGLLSYFSDVIGRDKVANPKPDPEPFLKGAAALGLPPEACAAFEDSDTGTTAAVAAGCKTWQIPDLRPEHQPFPKLGQIHAPTLAEAVTSAGFLK